MTGTPGVPVSVDDDDGGAEEEEEEEEEKEEEEEEEEEFQIAACVWGVRIN